MAWMIGAFVVAMVVLFLGGAYLLWRVAETDARIYTDDGWHR